MNRLRFETSPYLLQHANNPVDWYPWGDEAFERARAEDKPIFLSIGYSTCHWCHVMEEESFEDAEVADTLNRYFVAMKVDKEERPDIDTVYMNVCTALTGSSGWPTTIIADCDGKPFFAGTYFPKRHRYGMPGLVDVLETIAEKWETERKELDDSAAEIVAHINKQADNSLKSENLDAMRLINKAVDWFKSAFDKRYGGFGRAPKFPSAHNLLFLLDAYERLNDENCLKMAETTLMSMAKGGLFDHIGFGFSRYSTDERWLVPHFEKMLYDNALLIMTYTRAFEITRKEVYKTVAERTILYIQREMTAPDGGFYSAQDADSDGVEGKYYVFSPGEIYSVLGDDNGRAFCSKYDITDGGNFERKNIPNQIARSEPDFGNDAALSKLYEYRKTRATLRKDDKILTSWNALMIAALADASTTFGDDSFYKMAECGANFIENNLREGERVFTSLREGKRSGGNILDDYTYYIYALLRLYNANPQPRYLEIAVNLTKFVAENFFDNANHGFYLTSNNAQSLITRPKETYDGAMPSGNSVIAMNLVTLNIITGEFGDIADKQAGFMISQAANYPSGHAFFLISLLKMEFTRHMAAEYVCDENGCWLA